jgi:hypothetical protein
MISATNRIYWIRVDIALETPLITLDERTEKPDGRVEGALMEFGVTAPDEVSAKSVVLTWITSSEQFSGLAHQAQFEYIGEIDAADVAHEIFADEDVASALLGDPVDRGLWYRTGVGWYSDDE